MRKKSFKPRIIKKSFSGKVELNEYFKKVIIRKLEEDVKNDK